LPSLGQLTKISARHGTVPLGAFLIVAAIFFKSIVSRKRAID
jgi:hypothetical protein